MAKKRRKVKRRRGIVPRLARSLAILRDQVNALAPKRSKVSDGWIGDIAHAKKISDHNPNERGIVTAFDITHDPTRGCDALDIAEALRISRDHRIKYVIFASRIFSSTIDAWRWRPYTGTNPHIRHVHISVYDDEAKWNLKLK
jgi:hypothetical protein